MPGVLLIDVAFQRCDFVPAAAIKEVQSDIFTTIETALDVPRERQLGAAVAVRSMALARLNVASVARPSTSAE